MQDKKQSYFVCAINDRVAAASLTTPPASFLLEDTVQVEELTITNCLIHYATWARLNSS